MDTEKWGRSTARERYGSKGMKKFAEGGPVVKIIPEGVSGLSKKDASAWRSKTNPGTMNNISVLNPTPNGGLAGRGPSLAEEKNRGGKVKSHG